MRAITHADGLVASEAAFLDAHPSFRETAVLDELRATEYARLDASGRRLPRLHRRQPVRRRRSSRSTCACCATPSSATRTRSTRRRRPPPRSSSGARAAVLRLLPRRRRTSTRASSPPTRPARCGSSARPTRSGRRPLPADLRQPQLGQRHPRVRPREGRRDGVRAARVRPICAWTTPCSARYLDERDAGRRNLFAFPAQSNFSGVKHPLEWIELAHARGWDVLVDARRVRADQPARPVGLAARLRRDLLLQAVRLADRGRRLLARRDALAHGCDRPWFAGGTVVAANVGGRPSVPASGHARSRTAPSTTSASRRSRSGCATSSGSASTRSHARVEALGTWLLAGLRRLRHADGGPAVRVYGPATWDGRGATIAFNFLHPDGRVVDERFVDRLAADHDISVRTGCFCNPGAGEAAFRSRATRWSVSGSATA